MLVQAEKAADSLDMPLYAIAARWRRGALLGGQRGADMILDASSRLEAKGVRAPRRMLDTLAPGVINHR